VTGEFAKGLREEIFGPVTSVVRAADYEEALRLPSEHTYGNGVAIFPRDGEPPVSSPAG
jgi:malonate-semialdehyde dehydrogenase (acetylating)/methylmalonate-semialdehyde dehydrogenase